MDGRCAETALCFGTSCRLCHQGRGHNAAAQQPQYGACQSSSDFVPLPDSGHPGHPPSPPGLGRELEKGAGGTRVGGVGFGMSTGAAATRLLIWLQLGPRWTFASYRGPVLGPVSFTSWRVLQDPDHRGQFQVLSGTTTSHRRPAQRKPCLREPLTPAIFRNTKRRITVRLGETPARSGVLSTPSWALAQPREFRGEGSQTPAVRGLWRCPPWGSHPHLSGSEVLVPFIVRGLRCFSSKRKRYGPCVWFVTVQCGQNRSLRRGGWRGETPAKQAGPRTWLPPSS